jgi:rod shape determining protein RodA
MKQAWQWIKEYDPVMIGAALALSVAGILLIYSSQHYATAQHFRDFYLKQIIWLGISLAGCYLAMVVPLRVHEVFAYVYLIAVCGALIVLFVIGRQVGGATRWVVLGPAYIQPSELAKLAVTVSLARYLAYTKRPILSARTLLGVLLLVGVTAVLVLRQPDLGTSLVFWAVAVVMLFWAGANPLVLFLILSPALSLILAFHWISWILFFVSVLVALHHLRPSLWAALGTIVANLAFGIITPIVWNSLLDYQKKRILTFLDPGTDPTGAGYQIIQSKVAIGSGGIFGKGFLQGSQSRLDFLPARHTDFIFSVAGEEFGFLGAVIIIGLFALLLWRMISIGFLARNRFNCFLAGGIMAIVGFQMLVNIGMALGLAPVTGLPLPFVSYGGSSLMAFWFMIGLLANVHRHWQEY